MDDEPTRSFHKDFFQEVTCKSFFDQSNFNDQTLWTFTNTKFMHLNSLAFILKTNFLGVRKLVVKPRTSSL